MPRQYRILYARSAAKAIKKLDRTTAKRITEAISNLAKDPRPAGSIKLAGGDGERRIRVGDYRVIYKVEDDQLIVIVLKAGHRRSIYQ